jgi:hypothetical protein
MVHFETDSLPSSRHEAELPGKQIQRRRYSNQSTAGKRGSGASPTGERPPTRPPASHVPDRYRRPYCGVNVHQLRVQAMKTEAGRIDAIPVGGGAAMLSRPGAGKLTPTEDVAAGYRELELLIAGEAYIYCGPATKTATRTEEHFPLRHPNNRPVPNRSRRFQLFPPITSYGPPRSASSPGPRTGWYRPRRHGSNSRSGT